MTLEQTFGCGLYYTGSRHHPPEAAPAVYWKKIVLDYGNGAEGDDGVTVLVYTAEPADPEEIPTLMRRLEGRAAASGFTISVMDGGSRA